MLKNGKPVFEEGSKDEDFIIPESVERFYPTMYRNLYEIIREKGKIEFERTKGKEEVIEVIHGLLELGKKLGHSTKPSDEMLQYFAEKFDPECMVEFLNRRRKTGRFPDPRHDFSYIEQDLPLAGDDFIERLTERISEWGKIEDEIASRGTDDSEDGR